MERYGDILKALFASYDNKISRERVKLLIYSWLMNSSDNLFDYKDCEITLKISNSDILKALYVS